MFEINGNFVRNPSEKEAFNHYFVDSVTDISQGFSVNHYRAYPATTAEPALTVKRKITETKVMKSSNPQKQIICLEQT